MNVKFVLIMAVILCVVSCVKSERPASDTVKQTERQPKISSGETHGIVSDSERLSVTSSEEADALEGFSITSGTVINADCDYEDKQTHHTGRLQRGQEIVFIGSYYYNGTDGVITEVATAINGEQTGTPIYVAEKYITFLDGERYDFWFKNKLLTREYYYTGTVEEIFKNDYGREIEQEGLERQGTLGSWRYFYSENRLHISDNYLSIGNDEITLVFRLDSVIKASATIDSNIYTLYLTMSDEKFEITLMDDGSSIIITQYVAIDQTRYGDIFKLALNFRYVLCDSVKSQRTKDAVMAWR